jgi:tRNA threonylcarbamoyladenosine biosynthesis protein TsaB
MARQAATPSVVLAFDTSADVTAVALLRDGRVLAQAAEPSAERHAQLLLPRVSACLAAAGLALADVELFAVGIGPGSFTGVRVGLATAKGFGLASGKPVCGVSSLRALARAVFDAAAAPRKACVMPLLDAHKGEVFAAAYRSSPDGSLDEVVAPFHALPAEAAQRLTPAGGAARCTLLGAGYRRYADAFAARDAALQVLDPRWDVPNAAAVASEALRDFSRDGAPELASLVPSYLRGSDAQLPKAPLRLS